MCSEKISTCQTSSLRSDTTFVVTPWVAKDEESILDEVRHPHYLRSPADGISYQNSTLQGKDNDPMNFSWTRKMSITILTSFFTFLVGKCTFWFVVSTSSKLPLAASATSFSMGASSMMRDLNCSKIEATLGLSLYCLGFGILPLFTSALSEEFGRLPLYYASITGFLLMHLVAAL